MKSHKGKDKLTPERRSENMRKIRSKNTKPEMLLRSALHKLGYRFRVHVKELPGKPDIVFPSRKKVIFVHGCFWHMHDDTNCKDARLPKTRQDYWIPKLRRNVIRDAKNIAQLQTLGWKVLVVWECETKAGQQTIDNAMTFLQTD